MGAMALCDDHWTELRLAVEAEGLTPSANAEIAAIRTLAELEESDDPAMFDPLMYAMWNMLANGSKIFNRPLLLVDGCPICHLIDLHDQSCDGDPRCRTLEEIASWPARAADSARQRAEVLGEP
jgi:hypothetical protein